MKKRSKLYEFFNGEDEFIIFSRGRLKAEAMYEALKAGDVVMPPGWGGMEVEAWWLAGRAADSNPAGLTISFGSQHTAERRGCAVAWVIRYCPLFRPLARADIGVARASCFGDVRRPPRWLSRDDFASCIDDNCVRKFS